MVHVYPPVSGGKLRYRNRGPWLVLAKTSPVTYQIQLHARAEPEIVHVDKLLPYKADFKEDLHSWLHGEESDGRRVAETLTADNTLSEPPPEAAVSFPSPPQGGALDFGPVSDLEADVESASEEPSTLALQARRGLRSCQTSDHYASVSGVRPMAGLSHNSPFSTPMLLGLLMAVSTLSQCEASSGCSGGDQHLGEYTNTSPSVAGDGALMDPVVGGSPLLTESLLD